MLLRVGTHALVLPLSIEQLPVRAHQPFQWERMWTPQFGLRRSLRLDQRSTQRQPASLLAKCTVLNIQLPLVAQAHQTGGQGLYEISQQERLKQRAGDEG